MVGLGPTTQMVKKTFYLGTGEGGTGILVTYNADGKETIFLRD